MWNEAVWLGLPRAEIREKQIYQGDMNGRFVYYRLEIELDKVQSPELTADISANSRYRFWINGEPILSGPCRSDKCRQYYETVELGQYLRPGRNVFAVQVLLCDSMYVREGEERVPLHSVETLPAGHRLAMEGEVKDGSGRILAEITTGKAPWKVWLDNTYYLIREPVVNGNMGALTERIDFRDTYCDWKKTDFDASGWRDGERLEAVKVGAEMEFGILKTFVMEERPIPLLYECPDSLRRELGKPVLGEADYITVEAGQNIRLLFDGETLFNAYMCYRMDGGRDAQVTFTYFEKFTKGIDEVRRDDYINGEIGANGQTDTITLAGGEMMYEPFWYRTMRFLQVDVRTAGEALRFYRPRFRRTGYPLQPGSYVKSASDWVEQVYRMCVRTLQGCMMETYMDCPFWEQMQYPMDTRLQALFTYVCSVDTKLARKALEDFHTSMLPMGLIQGRAPSNPKQIISTFSLHYIFMLTEYYRRTGHGEVLRQYRADVDMILEYYHRHIGSQGLVENLGYWDFVDWQEAWQESAGRPAAVLKGPSTIINLMYGLALLNGAEINEWTGRKGVAEEYRARQKAIADEVQRLCWDEKRGLYREGPCCEEFTQHAQSWAVLNGMLSQAKAAEVLGRTFQERDVLRCYFSACYELFRACEKAACYELTKKQMEWWIRLLEEHCTTCPETPFNSRSECHAWSALPMYELIAVIAGIRRELGHPERVEICPHMDYLPDLEGKVITEYGEIVFRYEPEKAGMRYEIMLPEGMEGRFLGSGGETVLLRNGKNVIVQS